MPDRKHINHACRTALTIRTGRLPDIHRSADMQGSGYSSYGRYALTRSGHLEFGFVSSSHSPATQVGWYWAVDKEGCLVVSGRGAASDVDLLFKDDSRILNALIRELADRRIIPRPTRCLIEP